MKRPPYAWRPFHGGAVYAGAPGKRTFYRVKVPNAPGSGKRQPKSRVSAARRNLKEDGGKTLA